MRLGSLFSGIGGLDIACEQAFGAATVWQVEGIDVGVAWEHERHPAPEKTIGKLRDYARHGAFNRRVLARHFPHARQYVDVRTVGAHNLKPADVICGGFPCQGLSVAGAGKGLDDARSGLYAEFYRIVCEMRPQYVVIENVPALLKYQARLAADFNAAGYGLRWQPLAAANVGAPHRRKRVFVLCTLGGAGSVLLDTPKINARAYWPTAAAMNPNDGERLESWIARRDRVAKYSSPISPPLSIAVRMDRAKSWPTPIASDGSKQPTNSLARVVETGNERGRRDGMTREGSACEPGAGALNPAWVELLMGLPAGWTEAPTLQRDLFAPPLAAMSWPGAHAWPVGRGVEQPAGEPSRLVRPRSVPERNMRLRSLGNGVVPQQAIAALALLMEGQ